MARKIEVEVVGDTLAFERAMRRSAASTRQLGGSFNVAESSMARFAKRAAVTAGVAGLGALALATKSSITAATNLSEQINKASVVFAGSEKQIVAWSKNTAGAFGISARAALEAAGTFGNMLVPMGFARDAAAQMSQRMVELAADMASFNNADPSEVLEALRSGLAGETEPLRRFGVFLNDARLKQEALTLGLYNGKGALDAQAKAAATYSVILKDTGDAQGDFARTSDSVANQQRILRAEIEDLQAQLGQALLPIVAKVLDQLVEWTQKLQDNEKLQRDLKDAANEVARVAKNMAEQANAAAEAVGGWGNALKILGSAAVLAKIASLGLALNAVIGSYGGKGKPTGALGLAGLFRFALPLAIAAGVGQALKNFEPFAKAVDDLINKVGQLGGSLPSGTGGITLIDKNGNPIGTGGPGRVAAPGSKINVVPKDESAAAAAAAAAATRFGGLQPGAARLAGAVVAAGGTITAGRESGHSPTGGHGAGQALDIDWADGGPAIWAMLFPHRKRFRLLLGPPGLYMWGAQYYNARDAANHKDHIHAQFTGSASEMREILKLGGRTTTTQVDLTGNVTPVKSKTSAAASTKSFQPIPIGLRQALAEAELTKGTADDARVLARIRKHLRDLLDSKKIKGEDRLEVTQALKGINSEIERIEDKHAEALKKKAQKKRDAMLAAFKGVAAAALREFDKVTEAGLAQFDELTPAEKELDAFRRQRAQEERQRRREAAAAIEDPFERAEALRQLDLEDQESSLEERARLEREARDKEKSAYEEKRSEDRTRLQVWLDEQDRALSDGTKSWEKFYRDLREIAIRYGFPVGPIKAPVATVAAARAATSGFLPGVGSAAGGHVFDSGGELAPGINVVWNRTGRAERLVPTDRATGSMTVNVYVAGSVSTERDLVYAIRDGLNQVSANNAGNGLA